MLNFNDPITILSKIPKRFLPKLKTLGIKTVGDLLYHFPFRYDDFSLNKKIAETINVRINVGKYQHIEISKYAEKEIEYETEEEIAKKEDQLTSELLSNLIRNMRTIPEKLGKDTDAVIELEESITKAIPEWMKDKTEPNLAKQSNIKSEAEEKGNQDKTAEKKVAVTPEVVSLLETPAPVPVETEPEPIEEVKEVKEVVKEDKPNNGATCLMMMTCSPK